MILKDLANGRPFFPMLLIRYPVAIDAKVTIKNALKNAGQAPTILMLESSVISSLLKDANSGNLSVAVSGACFGS